MKQTSMFFFAIFALMLISSCGTDNDGLSLNDDGYGSMTLENGLTIFVNQDQSTSLTSARLLFGGGVLTETAENNGLTNLMTRMLLKGNDQMSAAEISEQVEFYGANLSAGTSKDFSSISFISLTENFENVLEIVIRSINSPTFPEEELAKLKLEVEGNIKASDDNQSRASSKLFYKTALGNQDYGLPTLGTIESIAEINIDQIREHYQKYVGGKNIKVAISTDLPVTEITSLIDRRFSSIAPEATDNFEQTISLQEDHDGFISFDRNQSFIYTGYFLNRVTDREAVYMALLNEVMGNNVGSRLWYLRQKEKLAYSVYTQYILNKNNSIFRAAIGTDTSKVQIALNSLDRELTSLAADGITDQELDDAKINLKNNLIYRIDTKGGRANYMAYYDHIGYGYQFILEAFKIIDQITKTEINDFVKMNFTEQNRYTSVVGKR